jgi:hypothetical protein
MSTSLKGGARPNSGAKKGQHRIAGHELRIAIENKLGMSYVEMLAETQLKLFNDFRNNDNVRDFIRFTENMSARLLANPDVEEFNSAIANMTKEELEAKRANLLTRLALEAATLANKKKESEAE